MEVQIYGILLHPSLLPESIQELTQLAKALAVKFLTVPYAVCDYFL
jgi:nucleoside recognition membrane protein YjiH